MAGEQLALAKHRRILKGHKDHRLLPQRAFWSWGGVWGKGQEVTVGGCGHHFGAVSTQGTDTQVLDAIWGR